MCDIKVCYSEFGNVYVNQSFKWLEMKIDLKVEYRTYCFRF